jgi:DNA-directed RNA polymerase specialized sigma24 family protein
MNTKATQLDHMLYAWLAETEDRKFDRAFQRYYEVASPSLVRYLVRGSSLPDLDCEQIAVDALLKFFLRAGRDRRQAAESVSNALPRILVLSFGAFHVRQVRRWSEDVGSFERTSMSFEPPRDGEERAWKAEIQAQLEAIPPLQRQGLRLLDTVRIAIVPVMQSAGESSGDDPVESVSDAPSMEAIRAFASQWRERPEAGGPDTSASESGHPGMTGFVDGAWTIVDALPALRIPTNGYLFDIAHSLYLDECKARGRKKRGGGASPDEGTSVAAPFDIEAEFPFDEEERPSSNPAAGYGTPAADTAGDPAAELIDEDFCERFHAYLRKPLDDAEDAYHRAAAAGKANAERKRLSSVSEKYARLMSVLSMRIEGQTQEAIAESLGLSRNQVKYMTEHVQAAYEQFRDAALRPRRS